MRIVVFCHSLISCWNNGHAHFLRGVAKELQKLGHAVQAFEPADGWSRQNLLRDGGDTALADAAARFPTLKTQLYRLEELDLDNALDGADLVIVHEWNDPGLVAAVGRHRVRGGRYLLLFHDTHHRALTQADDIAGFELEGYDGVLAFGETVREIYRRQGWGREVWTWHEAADIDLFRPCPGIEPEQDLIWVGNWGDGERSAELETFLLEPIDALGLRASVHGVRYLETALARLRRAGITYGGWLANHRVPLAFAQSRITMHVPRRPYAETLRGIPTIRVFEALACGIPLVSAPWDDCENLFTPGRDFLMVRSGDEMKATLAELLADRDRRRALAAHGLSTIQERHTCQHRAQELLQIAAALKPTAFTAAAEAAAFQLARAAA